MENYKLQHSGIKGMRWGIRRWQNKDGSLTPEGRKRYADDNDDISEEEIKKRREESKNRAIKSGDPDKITKWQSEMTNEELRRALERVDLMQRLSSSSEKNRKSGFDSAMNAVDKIDKIQKAGGTLVNTYNLVAKINNTFNKKFNLPGISDDAINFASAYGKELDNATKKAKLDQEIAKAKNEKAKADMSKFNLNQAKKKAKEKDKK